MEQIYVLTKKETIGNKTTRSATMHTTENEAVQRMRALSDEFIQAAYDSSKTDFVITAKTTRYSIELKYPQNCQAHVLTLEIFPITNVSFIMNECLFEENNKMDDINKQYDESKNQIKNNQNEAFDNTKKEITRDDIFSSKIESNDDQDEKG